LNDDEPIFLDDFYFGMRQEPMLSADIGRDGDLALGGDLSHF
jgi:hypothetical protein